MADLFMGMQRMSRQR